MIKAVIFDFDGLIIDTETCEMESYRQLYTEHSVPFPAEVYLGRIGGRDNFDPYEDLIIRKGEPRMDRGVLSEFRRSLFNERFSCEQVRPGVLHYLDTAKRLDLRIGLASSSSLDWVMPILDRLELTPFFECIRTFDYVRRAKPDPELYEQVIAEFNIRPNEAIAFEDSPTGALAAVRAGLHCVIVPNLTTSALTFPEVRRRLSSMEDVQLEELIHQLIDA
ncbi:HAD family hydrolase [Paenibacillus mendelii]|uniref:HAD family hydrolase n=1 Tax=Paenibacillus mendelii TaxID=206163 RepID=A0ABV6JG71_9BACL|nr:HAD-IA family hydrolase [Paenibacillus mendelii]MCQ6557780.1 HAD-IA family hydrolase [Paenibacillus mendelii]